jgi:hypothetical protein
MLTVTIKQDGALLGVYTRDYRFGDGSTWSQSTAPTPYLRGLVRRAIRRARQTGERNWIEDHAGVRYDITVNI